jgi:NAD(P)H-hydrate epimerase
MIRLTRSQVREVDRLAIEQYGIPGIVLMENAATGAAAVARDMLGGRGGASVLILCGGGNNGGDGLAIARHLSNHGISVRIALTTDPAKYSGDARINWDITRAMNLAAEPFSPSLLDGGKPDLIIDAIFGTGLDREPRAPFAEIARWINSTGAPVLAIDLPSGLDCDTGEPRGACIVATRTVTFVAEKVGFQSPAAGQYLGIVTVAGIGCPTEAIQKAIASK